jgi:uncharacterized protein YbgA (DUF1722 family)
MDDPAQAESVLVQLYTHRRLREQLLLVPTRARLISFHASHKYLYLAHDPVAYRNLGRMVAATAAQPVEEAARAYGVEAMAALAVPPTRGKHANVLEHILGHLGDLLTVADRGEIVARIAAYRAGLHELAIPLDLLAHHVRSHKPGGWLAGQIYFEPYPRQLGRPPRMG